MGIAMACCLTAYLLIAFNIEFNSYFEKDDVKDLVKVVHHQAEDDGSQFKELMTPAVMAPLAAEEVASIEKFSRYTSTNLALSASDEAFYETVRFADADFFQMIDIGLISGAHENFQDPNSIFLTEKVAKKFFADEEPVGQIMQAKFGEELRELIVGGIIENMPLNNSFNIQVLMRMETLLEAQKIESQDWNKAFDVSLIFELSDINQIPQVEKQLDRYVDLYNSHNKGIRSNKYELIPFHKKVSRQDVRQSDLRLPIPAIALYIFAALGGVILLIACFNLTNTTLALTGRRLKEIGVRKVIGSSRWQIVYQFLLEMIVTILLALMVSYVLVLFMIPEFAAMWRLDYGLEDLNGTNIILTMVGLLFISAILAGIYPALFNSRFSPIALFRSSAGIKGTNGLTRILLVFQFSLSVIMLCGGIILSQNMTFQKQIDFGYDHKSILSVNISGEQAYNRLNQSISNHPKVNEVSAATNPIGPYSSRYTNAQMDTLSLSIEYYSVGANYFETVGLKLISGRHFEHGSIADAESYIMVDENFVSRYLTSAPLGTVLKVKDKNYQVIGVVSNHLSGLKDHTNSPYVYFMSKPEYYSRMVINTDSENRAEVKRAIEVEWKKLFPNAPFQADLQEDILYSESEEATGNLRVIFIFLTILGSLLSASGIYALANLNAQKRSKEIGVRKVLGASVRNIIRLVNREFVIILLISLITGALASFVIIEELMKSLYAQYQSVKLTDVIIGGMAILIIGLIATTATIYKSAIKNPVTTLRE